MRFEFNGYVGRELTPEEEAAFKRILNDSTVYKDTRTPLEVCEEVCTRNGMCDMLPCPKNRYGWRAENNKSK